MSVISLADYRMKRVLRSPEALIQLMHFSFADSMLMAEEGLKPLISLRDHERLAQYLAAFGFEHYLEEPSIERVHALCMVLKEHFVPSVLFYLTGVEILFNMMASSHEPDWVAYEIAVATQDRPRIKELQYIVETYLES